ncbi:MAG: hypothetical protein IJX51_04245 [Clostridia bacterium]|nr:hypothetical protein [Clostridia bacterium]
MTYTMEEKYESIKKDIIEQTSKNPIEVAKALMKRDYINIHGPEHHFLDGASLIIAFRNAGGNIDIDEAFEQLSARSIKMPPGMCGRWGVCGAVTGVGAAMAVINSLCHLTNGDMYGENMEHTCRAVQKMSTMGGPRCCKRNAYITLSNAVSFLKEKYGIELEGEEIKCQFFHLNPQCIKERCIYYPQK